MTLTMKKSSRRKMTEYALYDTNGPVLRDNGEPYRFKAWTPKSAKHQAKAIGGEGFRAVALAKSQ